MCLAHCAQVKRDTEYKVANNPEEVVDEAERVKAYRVCTSSFFLHPARLQALRLIIAHAAVLLLPPSRTPHPAVPPSLHSGGRGTESGVAALKTKRVSQIEDCIKQGRGLIRLLTLRSIKLCHSSQYGAQVIPITSDQEDYLSYQAPKGLLLLGFVPNNPDNPYIPRHHYMKVSCIGTPASAGLFLEATAQLGAPLACTSASCHPWMKLTHQLESRCSILPSSGCAC